MVDGQVSGGSRERLPAMPEVSMAVTIGIAGLLSVSGLSKFRTGTFIAELANYRILPTGTVVPIATALPWAEIVVAVALLLSPTAAWPLGAAAVLLALFTTGVVTNLVRGRKIACGCRGTSKPITWRLATVNAAWIVAATVAAVSAPSPIRVLASDDANLSARDGAAVVLAVFTCAVGLRLAESARALGRALARTDRLAARRSDV